MFILLLCFLTTFFVNVYGQDPPCNGRDQCSCVTADGKVIDLSSIGSQGGTAAFSDVQASDGYMYSYNPCYGFTEMQCIDASVCQIPQDRSASYPAGDASSAVFSNDGINNHVLYSSTGWDGVTRNTDVTLVCDPSASSASFQALGEQGSSTYYLTLTSKCACPDGCSGDTPPGPNKGGDSSGLSAGSVLLIVFISLCGAYLIGGIIFMKFVKKASGKDVIPNSTFWGSLPGHAKAGVTFTYSKITGKQYSSI